MAGKSESFTPMMQQYLEVKDQYKDYILMYRLGDFYEMFFDDAKTVSKELDLTLTGRSCGQDERAPMCGVPFHSAEGYIARLISKGYKVAICEQTEDPALAKGLVKREVVRMITPGTVMESSMLDECVNSFISAIYLDDQNAAISVCDISTGEAYATSFVGDSTIDSIINELGRFMPKEIIFSDKAFFYDRILSFAKDKIGSHVERGGEWRFEKEACLNTVKNQFETGAERINDESNESILKAVGGLLSYLHETQKSNLPHINTLQIYTNKQFMELDFTARKNLELTSALHTGEKRGSLLWVLDHTATAVGARLIRQWVEKPLLKVPEIIERQNAVSAYLKHRPESEELQQELKTLCDLERVAGRIVFGSANCRDLRALLNVTLHLPKIKAIVGAMGNEYLKNLSQQIDVLSDIGGLIDMAIVEEPPFSVREGGMIKRGFDEEVDKLRDLLDGGAERLAAIEQREKERTGIPKLKVGYNRVFGYYIEVSKSFMNQTPDDYIRKQTLANCERYITPELKELEGEVLSAGDRLNALEYEIFTAIRNEIATQADRIKNTAKAIATADCLRSFAVAAAKYNYVMPIMDTSDRIEIKDGRHPVVERVLNGGMFVPNDTVLDCGENRVYVITGPNMAGKSTFMRQVALITVMAQCGSFVPASSANIGVCDRVFTRIGASDDMLSGQSTFMVEMNEVAEILKHATSKSLLILDEIGRGTSTYDGMSIARAVLEYCAGKKLGARTLFATHYHELCEMEGTVSGVKNYNVAVKKHGDGIIFLKKIVRGGTSDSYGIDVAKLAGLPDGVIKRAKEVLKDIESKSGSSNEYRPTMSFEEDDQVSFGSFAKEELVEKLKNLEPDVLSPIEALSMLYELSKKAKEC